MTNIVAEHISLKGEEMAKRKKPYVENYNWHHRRPKIHGGSGHITSPNMIQVKVEHHRAWHMLFGTKTPTEIADTLNRTWLDPDWEMIAVRKEK